MLNFARTWEGWAGFAWNSFCFCPTNFGLKIYSGFGVRHGATIMDKIVDKIGLVIILCNIQYQNTWITSI